MSKIPDSMKTHYNFTASKWAIERFMLKMSSSLDYKELDTAIKLCKEVYKELIKVEKEIDK